MSENDRRDNERGIKLHTFSVTHESDRTDSSCFYRRRSSVVALNIFTGIRYHSKALTQNFISGHPVRFILREYGSDSYTKVIGSRSRSRQQ